MTTPNNTTDINSLENYYTSTRCSNNLLMTCITLLQNVTTLP